MADRFEIEKGVKLQVDDQQIDYPTVVRVFHDEETAIVRIDDVWCAHMIPVQSRGPFKTLTFEQIWGYFERVK